MSPSQPCLTGLLHGYVNAEDVHSRLRRWTTCRRLHTGAPDPLLDVHTVPDAHQTLAANDRIAPKARLYGPGLVLPPSELKQHLVRHRCIPHARRWVDIRQLSKVRFLEKEPTWETGAYQTPCAFRN